MDVKQKSGSEMVETDVPKGGYLKTLPYSFSPSLPIFKKFLLVINVVAILLHASD